MDTLALELLKRLPTEPPGITTTALREALAAIGLERSQRAIQLRLDGLEREGSIARDRSGKPHRWSIEPEIKRKLLNPMTASEALALLMAHEYIGQLLPPRSRRYLKERLDEVSAAIEREHSGRGRRWVERVRRVPNELPRGAQRLASGVVETISEALYEGLVIEVRYRKRYARSDESYRLHPLAILERDDALWLVARKEQGGELGGVQQFVLSRMRGVSVCRGEPIKEPARFSIDRWIAEGRAHYRLGEEIDLIARFRGDVAERLEENALGAGQRLIEGKDGWVRCEVTVPYTRALQSLLISYGALCVVESPPALRDAISAAHREALAAYTSRKRSTRR